MAAHPYHADSTDRVAARFESSPTNGLSDFDAARRLAEVGPNQLQRVGARSWPIVLAAQFIDLLILILLIAAGVSLVIGHPGDAITIVAVVLLNGCLGFVQEWRAEKSLEALESMLAQRCVVTRGGEQKTIDATGLVPGDLVHLKIGDRIPADIRLAHVTNLHVDESALTGESHAVHKTTDASPAETEPAGRTGMAFMGTAVVNGFAQGLVVATGMQTEFGRIAALTQSVGEESTPLQKRLANLGKKLGALSVALSFAVAAMGWLLGRPLVDMFLTGVALAVAIVPEALPIVVTTTLALGVRAMVKKHALFRHLQAAETLGSTTVICSDKTGTITSNEMTVTDIWLPAGELTVTGQGYEPTGHFAAGGERIDAGSRSDLLALLQTALICNHAQPKRHGKKWEPGGEATEAALVTAAYKAGLAQPDLQHVTELSFNSERKRMSIVVRDDADDAHVAHVKGAPEVILKRCQQIRIGDAVCPFDPAARAMAESEYAGMARRGLRVLAFATRTLSDTPPLDEDVVEQDLIFLGFAGIMDPPRQEVAEAMRHASEAGIRVVIITGDAGETAMAVAQRIGLRIDSVLTGAQIAEMSDTDLLPSLRGDVLFARTSPGHKLRIVNLLQEQGEIVAMTGDGVNDAPALKKADIGVAMGIRGTDVARSAADLILLDDNFRSIVAAVDEGRRQFDNIRKFVRYILSAHLGEVIAILLNILLGGPLILLPVQILWMNLVTDGMTAIALGLEPGEPDRMSRPPRDPREPLPNRDGIRVITAAGTYIALATVALFYSNLGDGSEQAVARAQTIAFTGLIVLEKINVLNFRSLRQPMHRIGWFSNPWMLVAIAVTLIAQLCAVYVPFMQQALHTVPLSWKDWAIMALAGLPLFTAMELRKAFRGV